MEVREFVSHTTEVPSTKAKNTLGHSAHNGESEYTEDSVRQARIVFIVEETHQDIAVRTLGDSQIEGGNVDQKRREVSGDGGPKMQPPPQQDSTSE